MKCINGMTCLLIVSAYLCGCSSVTNRAEKSSSHVATPSANTSPVSLAPVTPATSPVANSVLPPGPPTPNPYLQAPPVVSDAVNINFHDAVAAMEQKNWNHAQAVLEPLAAQNPKLSGIQLNLGLVYRAQGQPEQAEACFNRAIQANFRNLDAYNAMAVLKREQGDFAAAETWYKKALALWPYYPEGHKNIAILYELYMGKPEQALPHYLAYQQLLATPDKQVDSWIADLQRRVNPAAAKKNEADATRAGASQ